MLRPAIGTEQQGTINADFEEIEFDKVAVAMGCHGERVADPAELYAALDLGTNSCRMLIAQPKGNQFHVVDSFSKSVQLGQGLERSGRLSRAAMERTAAMPSVDHLVRRLRNASSRMGV